MLVCEASQAGLAERGKEPRSPPLKVQGGAYLPRRLYQSKGGSAVRILKRFLIVRVYCICVDGRKQEVFAFIDWAQTKKPVPYVETPIYAGNKISAQTKNRDEKSSLFVFYKIFAKPITEVSFVCFSFRAKQRKIIRRTESSHFMKI